MGRYENIVRELIEPLVENKKALLINEIDRPEENTTTVLVYGEPNDIAVLIGRKGSVATALREVLSIAGKLDNRRVYLKLESFDDSKKEE
ncbi:MAG TPA: KH domain-containing protein [Bacilli bacterium]|jgi:predicted RNA-binding protein YlqC (UPF0109 family)|nr:KH domain-containing protein [Bacilli bacterium]HPK86080.1 KH domain-containing protein [Bacilli bacterium]